MKIGYLGNVIGKSAIINLIPVVYLLLLGNCSPAFSQDPRFFHINSGTGLSSNTINTVARDKTGLLWIGTNEGLNVYDGYRAEIFSQGQLGKNGPPNITWLLCDSSNHIWIGTNAGLFVLDENRKVVTAVLPGPPEQPVTAIFQKENGNIVVLTPSGFYLFVKGRPENPSDWAIIKKLDKCKGLLADEGKTKDVNRLTHDQVVLIVADTLSVVDLAEESEKFRVIAPVGLCTAAWLGPGNILAADYFGQLYCLDTAIRVFEKKITIQGKEMPLPKLTDAKKMRRLDSQTMLIASLFKGIIFFNSQTATVKDYAHDPLNVFSLSESKIANIFFDNRGNIFVATYFAGLNCFNPKIYRAFYSSIFSDSKGAIYDNYINDIFEDRQRNIWLAAYDRLIYWNPRTNTSRFITYRTQFNTSGNANASLEFRAVCSDNRGRIWASAFAEGILLIDTVTRTCRTVVKHQPSASSSSGIRSAYIHDLFPDKEGKIWACSGTGVFTVDTKTLEPDTLHPANLLQTLNGKRVFRIWEDAKERMWFATESYGAYCYNKNGEIKNYATEQGLPSNTCRSFTEDKSGNIYIATSKGLVVLDHSGKMMVLGKQQGLDQSECRGLLSDDDGNIWFVNKTNLLVCYKPSDGSYRFFSDESGLSNSGYKTNSFYKAPDGTLYWGNNKGLSFFDPSKLLLSQEDFSLSIRKLILQDTVFLYSGNGNIRVDYNQNDLVFHFAAVNYAGLKNLFYRYMLKGFEKKWVQGKDITSAVYHSLPPGNYTFQVMASRDGSNWVNSLNEIHVHIRPPFWKTWWFRLLGIALLACLFYALVHWQRKKRLEKEKLKIEYEKRIAAVEMNTLRAQMNPHFIFNSLNSINTFILKNDQENASDYLQKFSSLVRLILDNSRSDWIMLSNELKALELYLQLELARYNHQFSYKIHISPEINPLMVWVPPLIIQPYAENAIRHGLIHRKMAGGALDINIIRNQDKLQIEITDNGIGRAAAAQLKSAAEKLQRTSHGMQITAERLDIINNVYNVDAAVEVSDRKDDAGNTEGTRVLLTIQYKSHAGNTN